MIIDNGSSDDTQLIIKRFVATFSGAVQLVSEPKRGLANAHNAGFRKARSPICVFRDDDCYPSDDYLDAMSLCFAEDPGIGFIEGRILPWTDDDCKVAIQKSINRVSFSPSSFIPTGVIHGANFACRRAAIEAAGGFDSRFGPGAPFFNAEEVELLARISNVGWAGAYDPSPLVYHHHGRKTDGTNGGSSDNMSAAGADIMRNACLTGQCERSIYPTGGEACESNHGIRPLWNSYRVLNSSCAKC